MEKLAKNINVLLSTDLVSRSSQTAQVMDRGSMTTKNWAHIWACSI